MNGWSFDEMEKMPLKNVFNPLTGIRSLKRGSVHVGLAFSNVKQFVNPRWEYRTSPHLEEVMPFRGIKEMIEKDLGEILDMSRKTSEDSTG